MTLSAAVLLPAAAYSQSLRIFDLSCGTTEGNMKAELLDAGEMKIKSVKGITHHMPTGDITSRDTYNVIDEKYIIADLWCTPGNDYFYSLEVTLDDGTEHGLTLKTDMFNASFTEGAVWATDLDLTVTKNPANGEYELATDECPNGKPLQIHPTSTYSKGVSARSKNPNATGWVYLTYATQKDGNFQNQFNQPFTYTKFSMGLQAFNNDESTSTGYARIEFGMNGAAGNPNAYVNTGSKATIFAYYNPSRAGKVYYFDRTETMNPNITAINYKIINQNATIEDNYANLAACRLYYNVPPSTLIPQTIHFNTEGGYIFNGTESVQLSAVSSGETKIYYSIVQGADIAELDENNVLTPMPGKNGEVVVEAMTFGDKDYAPASSTLTFNFRFGPVVEYLYTHVPVDDNTDQTIFIYVEPQEKTLEKLELEVYDNVKAYRSLTENGPINLLSNLEKYKTGIDYVYAIPFTNPTGGQAVHRLNYKFADEEEVTGRLYDGREPFVYLTDLDPAPTVTVGYRTPFIDTAYNNDGELRNDQYSPFGKGYGVHAVGYIETPTSLDLSQFTRFCVEIGGQQTANRNRGKLSYALYNGLSTAYLSTGNVPWNNVYEWDFPLQSTGAGKTVKVVYGHGGDGNSNDVVCVGAPRLYYLHSLRAPQTIEWGDEVVLNDYKPFDLDLDATTSTGLTPVYRVVAGHQYAEIKNGTTLHFKEIPSEGVVVVEAFQPGNKDYEPSNLVTRSFRLRKSVLINETGREVLQGGGDIDELVISANAHSAGQALVQDGIVNVKKLIIKYEFVPGEINFVTFPSDLDLAEMSDVNEKGYAFYGCTAPENKKGTVTIRSFNHRRRSTGTEDAWETLGTSKVSGKKGYTMVVENDNPADTNPVEFTFTIDNVALDLDSKFREMNLSVDMSQCQPETRHTVYVRPATHKGNTLRIDMRYVPTDISQAPVNHERALDEMRVTHSQDRGSIRLTLPEQSPARVAIFDRKGKKMLKAVDYVAPNRIDISDLTPGKYKMVVVYGPASRELDIEL